MKKSEFILTIAKELMYGPQSNCWAGNEDGADEFGKAFIKMVEAVKKAYETAEKDSPEGGVS